ncbi:hypothetical protein [Pseudonocardia acaciae]|uniref:carboxylate--amine ligase n=1 Tax=Pseudonocardia acaciae TaxID=551276 RepID=UPI0004920D63|nr:hypothetical protein [Pseudonocardia acaciae]
MSAEARWAGVDASLPPALIAGGGTPTGLALARGLRGRGVPIVGVTPSPGAPTCRSRMWDSVLRVEEPTARGWLTALDAAHERYGRMVLFLADDPAVRFAAEHAAELESRFDFVLPDLSTVDRLLDKSTFHEWALAHGFPVPQGMIVANMDELHEALEKLSFPVVLKPVEHTRQWTKISGRHKVYRLDDPAELDALPFDPFDASDRFIVQEWISGRDSDVYFCLTYRDRRGAELATSVGRKLAQWPVDVGSTAVAVTHHDPELESLTRRLLDAAGHVGFGSLEVRRNRRDGRMMITEPTVGRPDLQTALAAAARVNLVDVAYSDALRLPPPPAAPAREAIWVHETAFPLSVLVGARRGRLDVRALLAALRTRRAPIGTFFSVRDPLPFLIELGTIARKVVKAVLGKVRGGGDEHERRSEESAGGRRWLGCKR